MANTITGFYKVFDDASQFVIQVIPNDSFRRFVSKNKL